MRTARQHQPLKLLDNKLVLSAAAFALPYGKKLLISVKLYRHGGVGERHMFTSISFIPSHLSKEQTKKTRKAIISLIRVRPFPWVQQVAVFFCSWGMFPKGCSDQIYGILAQVQQDLGQLVAVRRRSGPAKI